MRGLFVLFLSGLVFLSFNVFSDTNEKSQEIANYETETGYTIKEVGLYQTESGKTVEEIVKIETAGDVSKPVKVFLGKGSPVAAEKVMSKPVSNISKNRDVNQFNRRNSALKQ